MAHHNQFIITPETCVDDMLNGVQASYPGLSVDIKSRVIFHAQDSSSSSRNVGLLSGGGSGHEPFAAGYVGEGMLTAAVAGSVFSAPPASHVLTAICNVAAVSSGGVLVILNNYTGDILNFGLAVERAKAKGYNVNSIVIDEDCAIDRPEGAGKRGLCGCLFALKIAGGMSMMGKSLEDITSQCARVKERIATLGVTVRACNMPGLGLMFHIADGSMEVGVGIHGEAGAARQQMLSAEKIVNFILEKLCNTLNMKEGDKVCTIVNNLGGSSQLELFLVAGQVSVQLKSKGIQVVRQYVGTLMTSLDMAGMQVSLLRLPTEDRLWLDCLDAPTSAFAWPGNSLTLQASRREIVKYLETDTDVDCQKINDEEASELKLCLKAVAEALKNNEQKLNELDKGCGDGDTGSTLKRMADAILQDLENIPAKSPQLCFLRLSRLAEEVMGGTSGALYSLMFVGAARHAPAWDAAWQAALDMAMTYSNARLGSRTMFDALIPACEVFKSIMTRNSNNWQEALSKAVDAADDGCSKTQFYKPLFGRASYVEASNIRSMDAGAYGVTVWLKALKNELL